VYYLAVPEESVIKKFSPVNRTTNLGNFSRVAGIPFTKAGLRDLVVLELRAAELGLQRTQSRAGLPVQSRAVASPD